MSAKGTGIWYLSVKTLSFKIQTDGSRATQNLISLLKNQDASIAVSPPIEWPHIINLLMSRLNLESDFMNSITVAISGIL